MSDVEKIIFVGGSLSSRTRDIRRSEMAPCYKVPIVDSQPVSYRFSADHLLIDPPMVRYEEYRLERICTLNRVWYFYLLRSLSLEDMMDFILSVFVSQNFAEQEEFQPFL